MKDNSLRQIYIKQKDNTDALFNELDDFFELMHNKEEKCEKLFYDDMRELYLLWNKYCQAQFAMDIITDTEFDEEDEEES